MRKSTKTLFFCRRPFSGRYIFNDDFFLYPWKGEPQVPWLGADHPIIAEISLDNFTPENPELEWIEVQDYTRGKMHEILTLLSTITNYRFFLYTIRNAWIIPYINNEFQQTSVYGQLGYHSQDKSESFVDDFSDISRVDPREYYGKYGARLSSEPVSLPESIDHLVEKYYSLDAEQKKTFSSASTLFVSGLDLKDNRVTFSLALIGFVSSIETLIAYEHRGEKEEFCDVCGNRIWGIRQKFLAFYEKYTGSEESRQYADHIYGLRSKILHDDHLLASDTTSGFELMDSVELENMIRSIRICIVNWLIMI